MAFSLMLERETFCKATHISLKQRIKDSLSKRLSYKKLLSLFTFRTESDNIKALKTIVFIQKDLPNPSKRESYIKYLHMAKVLFD